MKSDNTAKRQLYAEWWYCWDKECDCHQPQIVERSTVAFNEPGWTKHEVIEQGPYNSQPTAEDWKEMKAWMDKACWRYGLEPPAAPR